MISVKQLILITSASIALHPAAFAAELDEKSEFSRSLDVIEEIEVWKVPSTVIAKSDNPGTFYFQQGCRSYDNAILKMYGVMEETKLAVEGRNGGYATKFKVLWLKCEDGFKEIVRVGLKSHPDYKPDLQVRLARPGELRR